MTTLTNLIPTIYESLDVVSRELVGAIPAVTRDSSMARASLGQVIKSHVAPAAVATDLAPGVTAPNDGDQTIGNFDVTMTKARGIGIRWSGEESNALSQGGGRGRAPIMADQFEQAFRALTNEIEGDVCSLYATTSRAYGTSGTLPFATTLDESAEMRKILDDNGCPLGDRHMILDTRAGTTMRKLPGLTRVNEAGDSSLLRQGVLGNLHGFDFRESAQIKTHTKGAANGAYVTNGVQAVGATTIVVATGAGAFAAGDVIKFEADTENQYVVKTAYAGGAGNLVIQDPGLRAAIPTGNAITLVNSGPRMLAFQRKALLLATRAPALPEEGDMADDRMMVTDPHSGLVFEISLYKQYRQVRYEVAIAWGWANVKPAHTAQLLR